MSDLRKQIREHYDSKKIPAEKAEIILARGRTAPTADAKEVIAFPVRTARPWGRILSLAAVILVFAGMGVWWMRTDTDRMAFASVAPRIIEFFGSAPELAHAPKDKTALRDWLLARGAPQDFHIPASLMPLESFACSVVDMHGKKSYLSCYWRETKPDRSDHDLIHLLVGRRSDFKDAPASDQRERREMNGWSFASWSEGDVVYTLATAAPPEKLTPFLAWSGALRNFASAH